MLTDEMVAIAKPTAGQHGSRLPA